MSCIIVFFSDPFLRTSLIVDCLGERSSLAKIKLPKIAAEYPPTEVTRNHTKKYRLPSSVTMIRKGEDPTIAMIGRPNNITFKLAIARSSFAMSSRLLPRFVAKSFA